MRKAGQGKLIFYDLHGGGAKVQIMSDPRSYEEGSDAWEVINDQLRRGDVVGVVESTKATSDIFAPISGTIVAVNDELAEEPERVNATPFGDGWLMEIKPTAPAELEDLLSAAQYSELLSQG